MKNTFRYIILASLAIANTVLIAWAFSGGAKWLSLENGLMENAQVALLLIAGLSFAYAGVVNKGAVRSAAFLMCGICLIGFIREVEFKHTSDAYATIKYLFGPARDTMFAIIGVAMLAYGIYVRNHFLKWVDLMLSWQAWAFYLSVALVASSEASPKLLPAGNSMRVFVEEALELNGYVFLLIASLELSRMAYMELKPTS